MPQLWSDIVKAEVVRYLLLAFRNHMQVPVLTATVIWSTLTSIASA